MRRRIGDYVKVILTYDIVPETRDAYYQYVLGEMVPRAETLGLDMVEAWHTLIGNYPQRLVSFVAQNADAARVALDSDEWQEMEERLLHYVVNYQRRTVPMRDVFQF